MIQVLVLLIVSAIVAYVGDVLGTLVGKRRLTIFGLRPRITAILVSISTGILITLLTLTTAAMLSDNVKIALFSVQQLNEERERLSKEVTSLKSERSRLQADLGDLQNRITVKEQEVVVYRKDTPIAASLIKEGRTKEIILASLTQFIGVVSKKASQQGLIVKDEREMLSENKDQLGKMAESISEAKEELVLAAFTTRNLNKGEELGPVIFKLKRNEQIFKTNEEIASLEMDGTKDRSEIARTLQEYMEEINFEVVRRGMIGNPLTGRFGDLSSESMLSFYDMVNKIKKLGRKITLIAYVNEDTFAIGPLNVSFRLEEENPGQ